MPVKELETKAEFDDFIKGEGGKLVVVDFYAEWCGPCKMIAPKIELWSNGDFSDVLFAKVNVDENEETAEAAGVSAMPTFKLYKGGILVDELVGASEAELKNKMDKHK